MRNLIFVVCLVFYAVANAGPPIPDIYRDRYLLHGAHYIRSEAVIDDALDYVTIASGDEIAAVAYVDESEDGQGIIRAFVLHFDRWGRQLHERVEFAPGIAGEAVVQVARHNDRTAVLFREPFTHRYWLRSYTSDGAPLSEPTLALDAVAVPSNAIYISVGDDRIIVCAVGATPEDNGIGRIYARPFGLDAQPLHDLIQVATPESGVFYSATVELQADGAALLTYGNSATPRVYRSFAQRITDTFELDSAIVREDAGRGLASDLATGGYMLNEYRYDSQADDWIPQVIEVDASGVPIGAPLQTDPAQIVSRALRSGRFCELSFPWPNPLRIRLFDDEWNALGPSQEFITPQWAAEATRQFVRDPMTYDETGTIWVVWFTRESSPFGDHFVTALTPYIPGDMNRDGLVNNFDIDAFVFALSNLPGYAATYNIPEDAAIIIGDINEDGVLNNFDIDPFVILLAGE
ncbi:MAG: hypothetical protein JNG88_08320 [Phycisphaerales bacterium]|nr:hypothetical protein [Phycisphaerales bacterium]